VGFVRKRVVLPTAFPGRGYRIHHTLLEGFIVSIPMGVALLMVDSDSSLTEHTSMRSLTEQMSIRSLKEDGQGGNFGAETVTSSSPSEDVIEDDEGGDASSRSPDGGRGAALTAGEGETMISGEGRNCWTLVEAISTDSSQGC